MLAPNTYNQTLIDELNLPKAKHGRLVLDLFAGCGGFALGFEAMGFSTVGYEIDADCCSTYQLNLKSPCHQLNLTPKQQLAEGAEIIIGGPPCQPFSVNGKQMGKKDNRDGFPAYISAVERYQPRIAIFENVRGMLYQNRTYFDGIVESLETLGYVVQWELLNAVNFGVPQNRERLFVVAHRGVFDFPEPTHKLGPFTAGDALHDFFNMIPEGAKFLTPNMDAYVAKYELASKCVTPRDLHLDKPSRTVTCRNLNGATGDMLRIRLADGRRRRLTLREGARLQSFPDWFTFCGSEGSQFNQVGNAVPPLLAKALARSVLACLEETSTGSRTGKRRERTLFN